MSTTVTRFNGTLKKWDVERGFGFIAAEPGGQEVFVHISAFPRDGHPAILGERLTFEIGRDRDGRKRAVKVQRPGAVARPTSKPPRRDSSHPSRSLGRGFVAVVLLAALGGLAYNHFTNNARERAAQWHEAPPQPPLAPQGVLATQPPPRQVAFQCDGRKYCSQMTSCEEAVFFLKNCPDTQMDGNGDDVPCERQWCK